MSESEIIKLFTTPSTWIEGESIRQLERVAALPSMLKVAGFPDIHPGKGGPVGLGTIAAALSEEKDAIECICEPFLIQKGLVNRTPRGRVATSLAYIHFGIEFQSCSRSLATGVS